MKSLIVISIFYTINQYCEYGQTTFESPLPTKNEKYVIKEQI